MTGMMPSTINMGSDALMNGNLGGGGGGGNSGGFLGASSSSSPPSSSRLNFSQMLFQSNMLDGPMHHHQHQLHHPQQHEHNHQLHHHHHHHSLDHMPTTTSEGDNIRKRLRDDDDFDNNRSGGGSDNTNINNILDLDCGGGGTSITGEDDEDQQILQLQLLEEEENNNNPDGQRPTKKKKRYHRHTQHQIQELESFFKQCPHPDDKQRKELGRELSLKPLQVKFWFQNKRTQMKMQHERSENSQLRAENVKLRADNVRFREALSNAACPTCGGPITAGEMSYDEHQLRIENARLKEEIDRIAAIAAKYVGKPVINLPIMSNNHLSPRPLDIEYPQPTTAAGTTELHYLSNNGDIPRPMNNHHTGPVSDAEKPMIVEMAVSAMEELIQMTQMNDPLWISSGGDVATTSHVLNEEEYVRIFPRSVSVHNHGQLRSEATRESGIVMMGCLSLVEILMDANQWSTIFASLVSKAMVLEVLSTGVAGTYNGALQVMTAEYQVSSPLVPTRASNFARYCKQHGDRSWAVVDFSLDDLVPGHPAAVKFRRRPSGCLFQELPNGYLKITWVEHVEVDGNSSVHNMYEQLVSSGFAFGAKRWVATLDRQCERLASMMATIVPDGEALTNAEGRKNMLKVTERMMVCYCAGVSGSASHSWTGISASGSEDIRVMTRKSVGDPGKPTGVILSAATSLWLPVSPKRFFDYLCNETTRNDWDILSNSGGVQGMINIANGRDAGNCASLIRVISENPSQANMLILQETCTDATASYVVYAPVDTAAMNVLLSGGNPDYVAVLPSGFAILPDRPPPSSSSSTLTTTGGHGGSATSDGGGNINGEVGGGYGGCSGGGGGSLVTVAFQILVDSDPSAKVSLGSVAIINNLIACTVARVKAAFPGDDTV